MNCPYCSREMARGYLRDASQPIQWIPEGKRPSIWKFSSVEHGVTMSGEYEFGMGYTAEAHHCAGCGVVIAKTKG